MASFEELGPAPWIAAIVNTLGCLVHQLSNAGHLDGAALVESMQQVAVTLRDEHGHQDVADALHFLAEHLLKSDDPSLARSWSIDRQP